MPKKKINVKDAPNLTVRRKFRIGTRKGGQSAHDMPNAELLTIRGKQAQNAISVLRLRGVDTG